MITYTIIILVGLTIGYVIGWATDRRRPASPAQEIVQATPATEIVENEHAPERLPHNFEIFLRDGRSVAVLAHEANADHEFLEFYCYQTPMIKAQFRLSQVIGYSVTSTPESTTPNC